MTLLGLVIVLIDLRAKLHFLGLGVALISAIRAFLLRGLVLELAVIHELGHRRACLRRNLHQIEVGISSQSECVLDGDDAHLLTVGSDQSDLGDADALVDAGFVADGSSC